MTITIELMIEMFFYSGGAQSLKRCGLAGDKSVVVELLPLLSDGSVQMRPPQGSFRVWVQRLTNPGCKEVSIM